MGADTDGWLLELVRPVGERPPLAALAPHLLRLFHAADCFPRGLKLGLFSGFYAVSAAMRYERYWLELMADGIAASAKPPLDVAFAWFVHRQDPADYQRSVMQVHAPAAGTAGVAAAVGAPRRAWLLPPELYGSTEAADGGDAAAAAQAMEAASGSDGGSGSGGCSSSGLVHGVQAAGTVGAASVEAGGCVRAAPPYVDELQYSRQTEGWAESLAAVQRAVRERGPFDGVFGFSQGAAVAAALCALQQQQRQQEQEAGRQQDGAAAAAGGPEAQLQPPEFGFRFALLASGFAPPLPHHRALLERLGPIDLPSLHVYGSGGTEHVYGSGAAEHVYGSGPAGQGYGSGDAQQAADNGGGGNAASVAGDGGACDTVHVTSDVGGGATAGDRQIPPRESEALAAEFACGRGQRRVVQHHSGHLIPSTRGHAASFRAFLGLFTPPP
ncbi:Rhodanese-like domain-containing protein 6 [Tetrabaena socialis]|uniref:Rhodanese-like domain-containing protein 6 n=1 Tax=Tetrabaena socialis TaxID=47790 RepID=A0A2J7ZXR8_9CHLO|nr:Rhodanese-like domain-containing protein 6 [Tetrabaena socialis]|eukprot:PNH05061.1 Rhodanese-like domain-containing protein 6 [Tetrabaena socialis]